MKFKMAATAGLSLTLDPMGKMFQNASSLKPLGQLKPNCSGMIIGRSSTKFEFFYADRKSKMATTAGHRLTLDPMGKCSNAFFSDYCISITKKSDTFITVIYHAMSLYCINITKKSDVYHSDLSRYVSDLTVSVSLRRPICPSQ